MTEQRLTVSADAAQLPTLTRFLQEFCATAGVPRPDATPLELALEEVFMNVVRHGAPAGATPRVEVSLEIGDEGLVLTIEDDGPAFDPLSLPDPDVAAALDARPVGGLGVYLVRQLMDGARYQRVRGRNQLRLTRRLTR